MSTRTVHTPFHPSDLISDRSARRASAHRRTVALPDAAPVSNATSALDARSAPATNAAVTAHRDTPSPAGEARILRRWSVAALIASAPRPQVVA